MNNAQPAIIDVDGIEAEEASKIYEKILKRTKVLPKPETVIVSTPNGTQSELDRLFQLLGVVVHYPVSPDCLPVNSNSTNKQEK